MEAIEALQARDTDAEEDARFGGSLRGDELPEELRRREDRLAAIVAAKARAAQREADHEQLTGDELKLAWRVPRQDCGPPRSRPAPGGMPGDRTP